MRLFTLALLLLAACSSESDDRPPASSCAAPVARPEGIVLAGSGSNLALVNAIVARYAALYPGARMIVAESIGTGGAVGALLDGVIDLGLGSRHLTQSEKDRGLSELPMARVATVVAVRPTLGVRELTSQQLLAIYQGRLTRWPDGRSIVPLLREPGDSGNEVVGRVYPVLGKLLDTEAREEKFVVQYSDQDMRDALLAIDGSVGLLDLGMVHLEHLRLEPVAIDGKRPTDPGYPLIKALTFILPPEPRKEVRDFLDFTRSRQVEDILADGGFLPPEGPP